MKFIKFSAFAIGIFVILFALGWLVFTLWWLFLAMVSIAVAHEFTREPKDGTATSGEPKEDDTL